MKHTRAAVLVVAGALLLGQPAQAQNISTLSVVPPASKQWDASASVGWFGGHIRNTGWDRWYSTASFDVNAGYYWTPHIKTELEFGTTGSGSFYDSVNVPVPGTRFPATVYREHSLRYQTVRGLVTYQFLDNQWVHPYVGVGIEAARERDRIEVESRGLGLPPGAFFEENDETRVLARPVATAGFKFYVSPGAFIRSDVQTSFSSGAAANLVWRGGVGIDF